MPAKKKKGKKGKKGKGKKGKGGKKGDQEIGPEQLLARSKSEMSALKEQMIQRKHLARKSHAARSQAEDDLDNLELDMSKFKGEAREVNAFMTRQYKAMQTSLGLRINELETDLARTQNTLADTEAQLVRTREEKDKIIADRDATIEEMQIRIENLHIQYETIMQNTLDALTDKLKEEWGIWEGRATKVHSQYKAKLLDYGLNPDNC